MKTANLYPADPATIAEQEEEVSEKEQQFVNSFRFMDLVARALSEIKDGADKTTIASTMRKLQDKFQSCDAILKVLPGGSMTHQHQLTEIKRLKENLENKQFLLTHLYSKHNLIARVLAQRAIPEGAPVQGVDMEKIDLPQENMEGVVVPDDDPMLGLDI